MTPLPISPVPTKRRAGNARMKKDNPKTDMTPMVDLGFLLIAFFVMTAELSKPSIVNLNMPKGDVASMPVRESETLTALLGKDGQAYYYTGAWRQAVENNQIFPITLSVADGLGRVIRKMQSDLERRKISPEGKAGLMLLIKPGTETDYHDLMAVLDETTINGVKRYAVIKQDEEEAKYLKSLIPEHDIRK